MTFDGSDPALKVMSFYINGVLVDRLNFTGFGGTGENFRNIGFYLADDIWLGSPFGTNTAVDAFRGAFDEIALYDRDLTPTKIAAIYFLVA